MQELDQAPERHPVEQPGEVFALDLHDGPALLDRGVEALVGEVVVGELAPVVAVLGL